MSEEFTTLLFNKRKYPLEKPKDIFCKTKDEKFSKNLKLQIYTRKEKEV